MLIKVETPLRNMDGQVMKDNVDGQAVDATLRMAMVNSILSPVEKESGMDKVKKFNLAERIHDAVDNVDLTVEEISLIKERVGVVFPSLIVGQVWKLLEGKD